MANDNSLIIKLQAMLDKIKSIANIKADIKAIEPKLPKVKLQGTLLKTATKKELNAKIKSIKTNKIKIDADTAQAEKKIKKIEKQKTKTTITSKVDNTQVVSGLKQAQKETKTLWERFTANIFGSNLIRMGTQKVIQAVNEAFRSIKELDTIKTNIQMVSNTSDFSVNAMMSSYNAMAKELSSTTKDVAEAANEFLRMGESVENTNELIRSSQILSKVGMIDSADAASYLISSLKGYQVAAENSIDVVSKLTSVDLEAAVSAGGLAEAISHCSNIANNSGTSMDRLIGYTAAVGEVTQESMSVIGNAFKSIYSRMNNIKIGKFIDDETGESLSDTETVLNKLGIQLRDTANTYRNFDDVLDDIGGRWANLTQVEQNALSVAIAGTMQRERFTVLMNNYSKALEYSEVAANSAGSALERYGVYQDSIEAKTNELTAAIESLSTNIISEDLYFGILQAATGLVEFLDKTNLLKGTLAGLVAMGVSKTIISIGTGFITAAKSTAQLSAAMALFDKGRSVENLKSIGAACKGLTDRQLKLVLSTKGLTHGNRLLILAGKGVEESEREQTLTTLGFSAAEDKATVSTFSLKDAMNALSTAIAMNPIGAIVTAVFAAVMAFSAYSNAIEETRQKVKELGDSFKSTKSEIENYKSQIEELYKTINDSNSSIEDVTDARKTLMSVQDELIDKFGVEKDAINDITDAINGQTDAFDRLTQKQWQETLNKFNDIGKWKTFINFVDGYSSNVERMIDEVENYSVGISFDNLYGSKDSKEILDQMHNLGFNTVVNGETVTLEINGNVNDVYDNILELQNIISDSEWDIPKSLSNSLSEIANKTKSVTEEYSNIYNQYVLFERILKNDKYANSFKNINDAYAEYQKAFASGDEDSIAKAQENFAKILTHATEGLDNQSVIDYFNNMYPALQSVVKGWQFNVAFDANTDNLQNEVQSILDELKDEDDRFLTAKKILGLDETKDDRSLTAEEILGLGEANKQYQDLVSIAHSYNMSIEEMIELLKKRNLVLAMDYQGLVSLFGQENIDKLTPEDLEIAYTIKNVGNMTFVQLQAEIQKTKEIADKNPISPFTKTISQVQSLSTGLEKLEKIYTDVKNQEDFDWSSILNNEEFANTFSGIGSAYDNFIKAVSNAPDDIEACQKAFDQLATSYIYNTKDTNGNNIMDNLTRSTKDATVAMLEQMGVANALEIVEAELSKKEEALEVQKLYASEHTTELTEASLSQANAYITEADCSKIARKYLAQLYLQKNLANKTVVSTAADCQNLIELAKTAGYSQSVLLELENLKQKFAKGERILSREGLIDINNTIKNIFNKAEADIGDIDFEVKFDSGEIKKSASSAAKSFTDLLDKELNVLDKKMEAGYIDFRDYIRDRLALIEDYYSQGKIKADEYYSYLENHYKQELSYRDKVIKAVTRRINKEIDSLEKQKDAIKENYQLQIDALENQKTLLEDANKERQRQIDLQKALYELERAKNQRTKLVYSEGGGMHYVADDTAIRDAENETENARHEIQISEIEKSITMLEKARDAETDAIDDMIDKLQEYKEAWSDITSAYEESQEDLLAAQFFGQEWEEDIINCRTDVLNKFKDDYIAIQQAMADAAWQSANEQIRAAQEAAKGADGNMGGAGKIGDSPQWEVVDESNPTPTGESPITFPSKKEAEAHAKELNKNKAASNGTDISGDDSKWMREFDNSNIPGYYVKKYHTGLKQGLVDTHSFDDDFKLVQKVGLGEKEVPAILKEGEAVATPAQISNIADGLRVVDDIPAERPFFAVEQEKWERCAEALGRSIDEMLFPMGIQPNNIREMTSKGRLLESINNVNNVTNNNKNIQQPVTVQIGDINLTGVQDVNGLSQAIKTRLPGKMMQEYFKN